MAYRLTSGGTAAKYVTIPTCSLAGDFDITIVATQAGQTNGTFLFAGTGVAGQNGLDLYRNQSGKYQIFIDNTSSIAGTINASNNLATPDTIRVSRVSGVVTLRVNGVVDGTTNNSNTLRIDRFFHRIVWAHYGNMAFYTMSITAASGNRFYDASASGGAGTSLPDTVSSQNGTLVGFSVPADYVYYNSVTANIPNNTLGAALNQACAINLNNYFTGATSYAIQSGSLPTGLSIVGNQIVGTPTTAQTTTLVIRASNSIDLLDSATITFNTGLWYLTSSPADGLKFISVNIPASTLNAGLPLRVEWEIEFEAARFQTDLPVSSSTNMASSVLLFLRTGSDFELRSSSNSNWIVTTGLNLSDFNKFRIRSTFDGTTHIQQLFVNDGATPIATRNPTTSAIGAQATLLGLASATRAGGLKYYKFTDFVTPQNNRYYDPNTSGGTGNLLIERVSNQNGTQVGTWPSNDSEWVSYAPAGGDNLLTATLSSSSSISANLSAVHRLSASLSSANTLAASLSVRNLLSTSLSSGSSISASLTVISNIKVFAIDVTGIPNGTYPVALFNHVTGDFISRQDLDFTAGHAELVTTLDVGTAYSGYVIDASTTPVNGATIYGQVTNAS